MEMSKLEKVIKGLECHRIDSNHRIYCADCPYYVDDDNYIRCVNDLHDDGLELLKEQEAVEPYMDYDGHDVWLCGKCGATIFHIEHSQADEDWKSYAKFCRHCGQAVKWNA